jgi:hypothetical protein
MPHVLAIDGTQRALDALTEIGHIGALPVLRLLQVPAGGVVVLAATPALRDGMPMLAGLAHVAWGTSMLVRAGRLRVGIEWQASARPVPAGTHPCRLCGGAFVVGEMVTACGCEATYHHDCHALCVSCGACGMPGGAA